MRPPRRGVPEQLSIGESSAPSVPPGKHSMLIDQSRHAVRCLTIRRARPCYHPLPALLSGMYAYQPGHLDGVPLTSLADRTGPDLVEGIFDLVDRERPLLVHIVGGRAVSPLKSARRYPRSCPPPPSAAQWRISTGSGRSIRSCW